MAPDGESKAVRSSLSRQKWCNQEEAHVNLQVDGS